MSKGQTKRDEHQYKKSSRHHIPKSKPDQERNYSPEESTEKRPSVFDRLGSKGKGSNAASGGGFNSKGDKSGHHKGGRVDKKEKHHRSRKNKIRKSTARKRKGSPGSSDESSSDDGSSTSSPSSSSTESSSTTSSGPTSSSSSAPSVKIRQRKKQQKNQEKSTVDKELRKEQKQYDDGRKREREKVTQKRDLERPSSQGIRPESSATKRKAPVEEWKQARYKSPPPSRIPVLQQAQQRTASPRPRRNTPTPDPYHVANRGVRREVPEPVIRERIRIVPPPSGRLLPLDGPSSYSSPKPIGRQENRISYQGDFRSGVDDKRMRERLAPARTPPTRDRIPPLLPEIELRRPPKFMHHHETNRGFNFHRPPPPPLLPERRELLIMPPKPFVPKLEVATVKKRTDEWVGETVSPLKKVKIQEPPPAPVVEEVLSEISDDDDDVLPPPPPAVSITEKEELEVVTSTLVEESGTIPSGTGITAPPEESQTGDSILENMDFEEISEDEFEDGAVGKKMGIVDALGVDWSVLLRGKEEVAVERVAGTRHRESSVVELLRRTGLHRSLVPEVLFNQVLTRLGELEESAGVLSRTTAEELEKPCLRRFRTEHEEFIDQMALGPGSRALSSRRDLALRRHLLGFDPAPLESLELNVPLPLHLKSTP